MRQLILLLKDTFEPDGVKIEEIILGTSKQDSSGLISMMVRSRLRRSPEHGNSTYTAVSAHLSNTTAKRRDVAGQLLGQLRKVAEENDADIVAGDFDTSTCRERGKAKMSWIEEAWEKTLLGSGS